MVVSGGGGRKEGRKVCVYLYFIASGFLVDYVNKHGAMILLDKNMQNRRKKVHALIAPSTQQEGKSSLAGMRLGVRALNDNVLETIKQQANVISFGIFSFFQT